MPDIDLDGLRYHVETFGAGRPLVLLHGFTGSTRSWQPLISQLASHSRIYAIDLPGHGRTRAPEDAARIAFTQVVDDLAAVARELGIESAVWAGYSMGGRVALAVASEHPALVGGLILESASPGLADPVARAERRQRDAELAGTIERDGVPAFVAKWEKLLLWESQRALPQNVLTQQRAIRLANSADGLSRSLCGMGTGSQPSYWERLPEIRVPTFLLTGALDTKFAQIATEMNAALPNAQLKIIPETGHAIHLERPQHYLEIVSEFMDDLQENEAHMAKEEVA